MTAKPLSKSQKRLLIVLAIVVGYAAYDLATAKAKPASNKETEAPSSAPAVLEPVWAPGTNEEQVTVSAGVLTAEWRRDPFRRYPEMGSVATIGKALQTILTPKITNLKVTAISRNGRQSYALINDQIVAIGEMVNGYRVVDIHPNEVVVKKNDCTFTLSLPDEEAYEY